MAKQFDGLTCCVWVTTGLHHVIKRFRILISYSFQVNPLCRSRSFSARSMLLLRIFTELNTMRRTTAHGARGTLPRPINPDSAEEELEESQFIIKGKFHDRGPRAGKSQSAEAPSRKTRGTSQSNKKNIYRKKQFPRHFPVASYSVPCFQPHTHTHTHRSNTVQAAFNIPVEKHLTGEKSVNCQKKE